MGITHLKGSMTMTKPEKQPQEQSAKRSRKGKPRRRGSGSVFRRPERKGKQWVAQIILEDGTTRQRYFNTEKEADEARNEMLYEHKRGMLATGPKQKLADHLTYWLEQVKKRKIRTSTYVRY